MKSERLACTLESERSFVLENLFTDYSCRPPKRVWGVTRMGCRGVKLRAESPDASGDSPKAIFR